jgi:hypothetical protein
MRFTQNSVSAGVGSYDVRLYSASVVINRLREVALAVAASRFQNYTSSLALNPVTIGGQTVNRPPMATYRYHGGLRYDSHQTYQTLVDGGDSGSPVFVPLPSGGLALLALIVDSGYNGTYLYPALLNAAIAEVDQRAGLNTGLTVTLAASPV